jgi:transposase
MVLREVRFMAKRPPPYAAELRRRMVALVGAGRDASDLAREVEPSAQAIGNGVARTDRKAAGKQSR